MKESDKNISGGDGPLLASEVLVSSSSMANVCCSIELEPRTLSQGQLTHAREVAADVVQKMEPKEASTPTFKGSRQVVPSKEVDDREENGCDQQDQKLGDCKEHAESIGSPCQCSVITTSCNLESPEQVVKEPLSAPF